MTASSFPIPIPPPIPTTLRAPIAAKHHSPDAPIRPASAIPPSVLAIQVAQSYRHNRSSNEEWKALRLLTSFLPHLAYEICKSSKSSDSPVRLINVSSLVFRQSNSGTLQAERCA